VLRAEACAGVRADRTDVDCWGMRLWQVADGVRAERCALCAGFGLSVHEIPYGNFSKFFSRSAWENPIGIPRGELTHGRWRSIGLTFEIPSFMVFGIEIRFDTT
jgi:hypothetical protein